jgi:hypothetical protein
VLGLLSVDAGRRGGGGTIERSGQWRLEFMVVPMGAGRRGFGGKNEDGGGRARPQRLLLVRGQRDEASGSECGGGEVDLHYCQF